MRGWASVSIFMNVVFGLFGSYMGGIFYGVSCLKGMILFGVPDSAWPMTVYQCAKEHIGQTVVVEQNLCG